MPASLPRLPDFDAPHRVQMGLAALTDAEPWIEIDDDWARDLREKRRLLRERREQVWVETEASRSAQREALAFLADYVVGLDPARFRRHDAVMSLDAGAGGEVDLRPSAPAALERASRLVQEDLCLLQDRGDGQARLTAGSVCFPTRWDLPSMLGLPMTAIHARVPGYEAGIAQSADRFFARMKPGRVFRRSNWTLVDDPALFQPTGKRRTEPNRAVTPHNAGDRVWLRMESQTLQRLPRTGASLFGIRVYRTPLAVVAADPSRARALLAHLRSMHAEFLLYKSFPPIRDAVYGYLERASSRT